VLLALVIEVLVLDTGSGSGSGSVTSDVDWNSMLVLLPVDNEASVVVVSMLGLPLNARIDLRRKTPEVVR